MSLLEIKDLVVQYKTENDIVCAVNGISLQLEEGDTLGLVGETGAGKTTTALSILGLLPEPPAKVCGGQILYRGEDMLKKSRSELQKIRGGEISMIFQDPMTALNPVMTVDQQIAEVIYKHRHCGHSEALQQALKMLEMVGIPAFRGNEYPYQFSGGMKQRIVIAIALACQPKLLLADEPTSVLDVTIQAQVLDMVKDLQQKTNTAMILITHDLGVVAETCDKVAIMYAGQIVEYGTLRQVFKHTAHPYTEGLFGSIPKLDGDENRLHPIEGLMPDPVNLPQGCKFGPRCPKCAKKCQQEEPAITDIGDHHLVMRHHVQEGGIRVV